MSFVDILLNIMLHFTPFGYLLCAALLLIRKKDGDKSRVMLAISFIIWGVMMLVSVVYHYQAPNAIVGGVLSMTSLNITIFVLFAMFLYPIAVLKGSIKMRAYLILLGAWVALNIFLIIANIQFREFQTFSEILEHLGEFNVIFRLVMIFCFFIMSFIIFYIPYIYTESRVSMRWIRWFCIGMQGCTTLYGLWILTGSDPMRLLMQIYILAFCLVMTYQELYLRIPSSKELNIDSDCGKADIASVGAVIESPIWIRMMEILKQKSIWRNPDLTLVELASIVGTNRTTLSNIIRDAGYNGFYEFLNTCRIDEFIAIIEHQEIKSIHETFFDVGFRSKTTAIRYFRQRTGSTPSEYLQKQLINVK